MAELKKIGTVESLGLGQVQTGEPSSSDRLKMMFEAGLRNVLYGAENAARAGVANWLNPAPRNISGMSDEDMLSMYGEDTPRRKMLESAIEAADSGRSAAGAPIEERMAAQREELSRLAVEDPTFVEKVAGGAGSLVGLAPVGLLAALTKNPQIAIAAPALLEAAAETGGAQTELVGEYGMIPLDAAEATKPLFAANMAITAASPGAIAPGAQIARRLGGNTAARIGRGVLRGAAEEAIQEGAQNVASGLQVSWATGAPVSETIKPGEILSDMAVGAALGGAVDVVGSAAEGVAGKIDAPEYSAVQGNGVSLGVQEYRKTGDVASWVAATTNDGSFDVIDDAIAEAIAEDSVESYGGAYAIHGRKYMFGAIGAGRVGSAIEQHVLQPQMEAEIVRRDYQDKYSARLNSVVKGLGKSELKDLMARLEDPAAASDQDVAEIRAIMDEIHADQSAAREAHGGKKLGYIKDYVPHLEAVGIVDKLLGRGKQGSSKSGKHRSSYFNPHALRRSGREVKNAMQLPELLDIYVRHAAHDIFNSPVLEQNRIVADKLEAAGLVHAAENLREYSDRVWADMPHPITAKVNSSARPVRAAGEVLKFHRRRLTDSALTGNLAWTLAVQPSSIAMTFSRHGVGNSIRALGAVFNPRFRRYVFSELRGGIEKGGGEGAVFQDVGADSAITGSKRVKPATKHEMVRYVMNLVSKEMEKALYAHGAAAAYYDGKARGFSGNQLRLWMNNGGSKTQSDYYRADQPGWQHSKELTSLFPFMSFVNELVNSTIETVAAPAVHAATGKRKGTGHYAEFTGNTRMESFMLAAKRSATLLVAMWLWEELVAYPVAGRRPFRDLVFGFGRPDAGVMMPASYATDISKAVGDAVKYNSADPLIKFANRHYVTGGAGINRLRETIKAVLAGGKVMRKERRGGAVSDREMFDITGEEIKSAALGPWSTEAGKEYANRFPDSPGWSAVVNVLESISPPVDEETRTSGGRKNLRRSGDRR